MRIMIYLLAVEILFLAVVRQGFSYDSYFVHPQINQSALINSDNLLTALGKIGYQANTPDESIKNYVNGQRILDWFREGGTNEDAPIHRANNHFHDPLKAWTDAGLAANNLGVSSLIWAQDQQLLAPTVGGDWSWAMAKQYYYDALSSVDRSLKEQKFADTFRSLGQVMHLIADASVPAHTRNDIHVFPLKLWGMTFGKRQTYESWAEAKWRKLNYAAMPVDPSLFSRAVHDSSAPVPISALWDQNKYDGTNPEVTWTTNPTIYEYGLAEYTNANYFSEDTIFTDYPHPRKDYTNAKLTEQYAKDGKLDKTWYIMGYQTERLAAYSYFRDKSESIPEGKWLYHLDKFVYESYADNLVPRAVGYSTALLDYFFRGTIDISLPHDGIYSATNDAKKGFTRVTLLLKNITPNGDDMSSGTIELVLKYRLAASDPFTTGPVQTGDYIYKVIPFSYGLISIPKDTPAELSFDLTNDPFPVNAVDVSLQVVYHGRLGNEDDAVAVGFKDINDPTPIHIYNNMDKICLNGAWYDAGSQEAVQQVDKNGDKTAYGADEWDVYPHNLKNIYIKFYNAKVGPDYASPTYYDYEVGSVAPQGFSRAIYVLGDDNFNYSFYAVREGVDQNDFWTHVDSISVYEGFTIKNQVEDPPIFFAFRGYSMWPGSGFIYVNPAYPEGSQCDLRVLQ
jgi:hypothetical protein